MQQLSPAHGAASVIPDVSVRRLLSGDEQLARDVFRMMAQVFDEPGDPLPDTYVRRLLVQESFWAFVASADGEVVGGLTAHVLPMTRTAAAELFIYDVAVRPDWQRRGVGRQLLVAVCDEARHAGLDTAFVPAESEDDHAVDFYRALGGEGVEVVMFTFDVSNSGNHVP